jgi:CheY-like chemotaxis protein
MAKILIAAAPKPLDIMARCLAGHEISCVETIAKAEHLLSRQQFDLIVCTVVFDDSRILEFLRLVKAHPEWQKTPFVCARVRSDVLPSKLAIEAVKYTTKALGAVAFIDVADYRINPEREMRNAIEQLLDSKLPQNTDHDTGD